MSSTVLLTGVNLVVDPRLCFSASGRPWSSFPVADHRRWTGADGAHDDVFYFQVTTWGHLAEHVCASLHKGDRINLSGWLEQQRWTGADGQKHSAVKIVAQEVSPSLAFAEVAVTRTRDKDKTERAPEAAGEPESTYEEEQW